VTKNAVDWSTDTTPPVANDSPVRHMGWFSDFPSSISTGERSVFRPVVLGGRLIYTTLIPSAGLCDSGGNSYVMLVNPATGARFDEAVLDVSGDGALTNADQVKGTYAAGLKAGIMPSPNIVVADPGANPGTRDGKLILPGPKLPPISLKDPTGRVTWREVLGK
jgi:type IV pilus assembly protein PilY1